MKKTLICAAALLLSAQYARADIITDAVKEVLQEKLEKTIDKDFKDSKYWGELLGNVAGGTPEVTVQQIMDDYSAESFAKDTGMKLLERLVPEAAGPIGLMITASEAAHKYTRDMLDFYKQRHLQDFTDQVLKPSKTTKELKANYDKFIDEYVNSGMSDVNVLYAERKDLENQYYDIFLKQFGALARAEKAEQARKMAQQTVTRRLKVMGADIRQDMDLAAEYLKSAGETVSAAALKRYRNDGAWASQVREKATRTAMDAKKEAKAKEDAAKKQGGAKPAEPPAAAGGGGGTILALAREIRNSAQIAYETGKERPLNYGALSSAYGQAADRVLTNAAGYKTFEAEAGQLDAAASAQRSACIEASNEGAQYKECNDAYGAYISAAQSVRDRLREYGAAARKEAVDLEAKVRALESPLKFARDRSDVRRAEYSAALQKASCAGGYGSTTDFEKTSLPSCDQALGAFSNTLSGARADAEQLKTKIKAYEDAVNAIYASYSDNFNRNNSLLDMTGVQFYPFKSELDSASGAAQALASSDYELGEPRLLARASELAGLQKTRRKAVEQLELNKTYLTAHAATADRLEAARKFTVKSGLAVDVETFDSGRYYDEKFGDFLENFLSGAIPLMAPSTKGYSPDEHIPFKTGYLKVWEATKYPFYLSVAAHEARLKDFREKLAEVREMQLERRAADIDAALKTERPQYASLELKYTDAAGLHNRFTHLAEVKERLDNITSAEERFRLFYGQAKTLSAKSLDALEKDYADEIAAAKAAEANMTAVFTRYQTEDYKDSAGNYKQDLMDARAAMNCKKWECSSAVWQAYNKMSEATNARWNAEAQKSIPVRSLTVNGMAVDPAAARTVQLSDKDLVNGEIVIKGELFPNVAGAVTDVRLALNGKDFDRSLGNSPQFSYSFKPEPAKNYYIAVKASVADGRKTETFPYSGQYFAVSLARAADTQVRDLYDRFKAAYESRSSGRVMALISSSWSGGDGTTAQDLDETLRNNFRLYDEISFSVSNLNISGTAAGAKACYDLKIVSRIYKRNLKHEEQSQVCEEVGPDESGTLKILNTLSGTYWYVK